MIEVSVQTRSEMIEKLIEIEFWPEVIEELDAHLERAIFSKDIEFVRLLLKAGANPNPKDSLHCYLFGMLHEYMVTKSTSGQIALDIMRELLKAGADPNCVVQSNFRAYDYAVSYGIAPVVELLESYGVDRVLREQI